MDTNIQQLVATTDNINGRLQGVENRLQSMEDRFLEMPVILYNAYASGNGGLLLNPTAVNLNGWAPDLAPPNPRTRDELITFTMNQCTLSAANLGLPPLGPDANVRDRRRQIAVRLGVPFN